MVLDGMEDHTTLHGLVLHGLGLHGLLALFFLHDLLFLHGLYGLHGLFLHGLFLHGLDLILKEKNELLKIIVLVFQEQLDANITVAIK